MDVFTCKECGNVFETKAELDKHVIAHNIVFVEFTREELFRLIQFIYTKDETAIPESLMKKLLKYKRGFYV